MKTARRLASLVLACAPLYAGAAATFTPRETLESLFDVEGNSPYASPYDGTLTFSALESKYASPNGHGYRNELKIDSDLRLDATQTRERFTATVTPTLPDGAKTIVAQYHGAGLGTVLKVYIQDTKKSVAAGQLGDGVEGNGVFDILVRILGTDRKEISKVVGTVRSGQQFGLDIRFTAGDARVTVTSPDGGQASAQAVTPPDTGSIYFKFGDYLQALDPDTNEQTSDPQQWDAYYVQHGIDSSRIQFSGTVFEREGARP